MTLPRELRADWASLAREYLSNGEDRETARHMASCDVADYLRERDVCPWCGTVTTEQRACSQDASTTTEMDEELPL